MPETIFFNIWHTDSREAQQSLISQMRSEVSRLAAKPGFLSLTAWAGQNDNRVLIEGRWSSRAHFQAAVMENPESNAAQAELAKTGRAEPGIFAESFCLGSRQAGPAIAAGAGATFIQIWEVGTAANQEGWLATMRESVGALTGKPGFGYLGTHASADGQRVAVYARWRDQTAAEAAVNTPEAKAGHQALRQYGTPDGAFYRVADVYLPDRTQDLREQASGRWNGLGFETRMIALGDVELFVATAGSGPPMLLLHGYPQSGEIWRFVAPELAKIRRVIIPDLRGMGLSTPTDEGYQLAHLASDIHQLLEQLDLANVDIAGHDWGAAVAAVYALSHPSHVRSLAFIESAIPGVGFETLWGFDKPNPAMTFIPFLLTEPLAETLLAGREEAFLHHLWNTFTHNKGRLPFDAWQPYVEAMKRPGLARSSACYYRAAYDGAHAVRGLIEAGKLMMPVLSVSGQASFGPAQRTFVEAFARNIREHVTVENSGHFVAEEQPEALIAALRLFFAD